MIFELRSNGEESRIFPSEASEPEWAWREEHPSHYRLVASLEANSWISAKKAFGFELTSIQARILDHSISHFELFGRHWSAGDMEALTRISRKGEHYVTQQA